MTQCPVQGNEPQTKSTTTDSGSNMSQLHNLMTCRCHTNMTNKRH